MLKKILQSYDWEDHVEGVKFVETHRDQYRSSGHWLFESEAVSHWHQVQNSNELWLVHEGGLKLHIISLDGDYKQLLLGLNLENGEWPVLEIPAKHWMAAELIEGFEYAFGTNVCAPPFDYSKFIMGSREDLLKLYPQHQEIINRLV